MTLRPVNEEVKKKNKTNIYLNKLPLNIYFYVFFLLLFTSSSAGRKDQFAVFFYFFIFGLVFFLVLN